jgi:methionyl-tRNA formyltransferase
MPRPNILNRYASGELAPAPQDHNRATTCSLIAKADGRINWQQPAEQIHNTWRAYQPWPGAWTTWNGKVLKVISCTPAPSPVPAEPGTVSPGGLVACGSGTALAVSELQLEGGSAQPFESFVRGYPTLVGSWLG